MKRLPLVYALVLAIGATGFAQTETAPRDLSLPDVISLALNRNLSLKRSEIQVQLRENTVVAEKAGFKPSLTASAGGTLRYAGDGRSPVWESGDLSDSANAGLSSSVTLYRGDELVASLEAAQSNLEASQKDFDRSKQSILFQSVARYLEADLRLKQIDIETEELSTRLENLERIQFDFENEIRIFADVQRQRALVADSERRLAVAKRSYENSLYLLKDLLLLPPVTKITLNLDGANWLEPENISEPNVEKSLASVLDRPDLLAQQFRLNAAKQGIRVAESGRKISVNASANLRTSYSSNNQFGNFGAQFFENQPDVSGGLSVSLPIFDRRRTETNIVRAKLQRDQEELDMADLMQAAETDFRLALLNFNSTKLQLKASKELLSSAEVALEAEQARYNAGAATLLDVTTLQSTRLDAAVSVEESRFDLFVNRLDIALQDGTIEAFLLNQLNTKILELE
ncbi:MAG: TolC family protein [Opitutales bacterium]|nr:TolC family protein [Opitutales bacterium]MBT6381392.1 TolC family protein [Opitutales bacterium]